MTQHLKAAGDVAGGCLAMSFWIWADHLNLLLQVGVGAGGLVLVGLRIAAHLRRTNTR